MGFWRQKKEELNDSSEKLDENREEVKSTEDVQQSSEEEQINKIIQQLHEEKHKNAELRQTIEQLQVKISSMDSKMKDMGEAADATPKYETPTEGQYSGHNEKSNEEQDETPSESQSEAERPVVEEQEQAKPSEQQDAIMERINAIANLLDTRVKELIADRSNLVKQLDEKVIRYDDLVSRIQEDRYRKDKVKILRRNINLRNLVSSVLEDYRDDDPQLEGHDAPAAVFLEQQLEKIIEKIDADLRQEMLVPLVNGLEGTDFDAEHQEIVDRKLTDKQELDGKVYKSVAPGYVWTLPYIFKPRVNETGEEVHTYKFLLRSEDVITYKYEKKTEI